MERDREATAQIERPEAIEHKDVNSRAIMIFLASLFVSLGITLALAWWLFSAFSAVSVETTSPLPKGEQMPPEPRIQVGPLRDIYQLRKREASILNSYGWVQQDTGIARIPIERAMDLLAQRGLPARTGTDPGPTVPATGPQSGGPQTGSPIPRFNRPANLETSGTPVAVPVPGPPVPRTAVPSGAVSEANR